MADVEESCDLKCLIYLFIGKSKWKSVSSFSCNFSSSITYQKDFFYGRIPLIIYFSTRVFYFYK